MDTQTTRYPMKEGMKGFIVSVKEMHISFSYMQINLLEIEKQVNMADES